MNKIMIQKVYDIAEKYCLRVLPKDKSDPDAMMLIADCVSFNLLIDLAELRKQNLFID